MKKLALILLIFLLIIPLASAEEVEVGTYILSIGEYNIEEGSYKADFYLWFEWEGETDPFGFEFMNGRAVHKDLLINESGYVFYRIEAELYETPYFGQYPIDSQKITIKIEDTVLTTDELVYVPDLNESGIDDEFSIMGWDTIDSRVEVVDEYYPNWNETYSRYEHSITIKRPMSTALKALVPFFFILLTAWACFFIPLHKLGEKLALGGTALLSSVVFHIFITEQIPPVGYLILADKFAIALYVMLIYTIFGLLIVEKQVKKEITAHHLNKFFIITSLIVPLVTFLTLWRLF